MSHYSKIDTEFIDKEALIQGLVDMGFSRESVEVFDQPQTLYGYKGDPREDKANVIIRRRFVGTSSNDLGFVREADGRFRAIISDFDSRRYNVEWLSNLKGRYMVSVGKRDLKSKGFRTVKEMVDENGKIHLVARRMQ